MKTVQLPDSYPDEPKDLTDTLIRAIAHYDQNVKELSKGEVLEACLNVVKNSDMDVATAPDILDAIKSLNEDTQFEVIRCLTPLFSKDFRDSFSIPKVRTN